MKRRFQLAKALVHDPDIIILDEPTAGIDVELRRDCGSTCGTCTVPGKHPAYNPLH